MKLSKLKTVGLSVTLLITLLMAGCSKDAENASDLEMNHMARFEESVLLKTSSSVNKSLTSNKSVNSNESFNTFKIENFDNEFVLRNVYVIDGIDYVDTGDFNDQVAGDGIYTSLKSTVGDSSKKSSETRIIKSDKFKFNNKLETNKVKIGCKFRMVYGGASSWFGNSCDGGCIELYDCSFEIEL